MTGSALPGLLADLVGIPSSSGAEGAAAEYAATRLAVAGLDVERFGNNVVARMGRGAGPAFLFVSHLDTVPVGEGWTRDPAGEAEGDRFFGRGANDAKASVAAMIAAFEALAARPGSPRGTLALALTCEEETTNAGMEEVLRRLGPLDGAVVGEPTGLDVVRAQSGLAVLRAEWTGRSCHAAHVARVPNDSALRRAAMELAALPPWLELPGAHPLLGASTVVPTMLRAGDRANVVPDRAEAVFDVRLAPPHVASDAVAMLSGRLPSARVDVRSDRLRPVETAADHPLVRAALEAAGRSAPVGSPTLSDMALLAGVAAVKCGPGDTARSHTPDEYVRFDELEAGFRFYRELGPRALEALESARPATVRA